MQKNPKLASKVRLFYKTINHCIFSAYFFFCIFRFSHASLQIQTSLILKTRQKKAKNTPSKSRLNLLSTSFLCRNFCQISPGFYQPTFDERYFRSRTSTSFRKLDGHRRLCTWNSNFGGYLISKRSGLAISYWISNLPHLNCKCFGNRHTTILRQIYLIGTTYVIAIWGTIANCLF